MYKNLGVTSWHDNKPEKRVLAKKRQVPDIYPQELKQEEDSLSPSRLKQGYALPVPNYEQETLFRAPKYDKFIDDGLLKCGKIITSVMTGKNEANNKMMSRQRSVNKEAPGQPPPYITKQDKREGKQQWFVDLNTLKSFSQLARRPPPLTSDLSKRNQECFDLLFEFRVPPPKAIWFLKFIAVHPQTVSTTSKGSKMKQTEFPGRDLILAEQSKNFIRVIADIVVKLNDFSSAESSKVIAFWNYLVPVFKHSFEDGLVDRQDFLMELAEVLHSQSNYPMDKPFAFRSLLVFYSHFICTVTQNVILARRVAHVVANRIRLYKAELDKCRKVKNAPETEAWYQDLLACQHHRPIIYTLTGILHAIVIECPQALIWNSFQVSSNQALPHQLCGSPLDVLPCPPEDLPLPPGPTKDSVVRVLKSKLTEIKRRSWGVKRQWALNSNDENTFTEIVDKVLAVITALDVVDITDPKALLRAYVKIFGTSTVENFDYQTAITVKAMIQWVVTVNRGGTYRVAVVIDLLKKHLGRFKNNDIATDTSIQDVLVEYLSTESPEPGSPYFGEEYSHVMLLFYELQRTGIFSHAKYVQALIRTGELSPEHPVMLKLRDGGSEDKGSLADKENGREFREEVIKPRSSDKSGKDAKAELIEDEPDNHILMSKNDNLTRHERFLIHLPIQQIEMNRSERNQRLVMLYGISDEREHATVSPRKVADNIVKIWQKKVNLEVPDLPPLPKTIVDASAKEVMNNREPKFRRKPAETYAECIATFKTQTYYDQHVIAAMCAESFIDMFRDFVSKGSSSHVIPTSESLDVLFYLMEYCQNINEIISISIELIPLLIAADDVLSQRQIPIIPGSLSAQHGYVITTYLSSHYQYFLMHPDAYKVLRGLFKLVEPQLRCKDRESCISAWARSISIFMLTAKMDLIKVNKDLVVVGKLSDLKSVFPSADVPSSPPKYSNGDRESAFSEMMKDLKLRRFMNYFDFKKKLSLLGQPGAGVSLVVAAFTAARDCGRRVEVLSDIATLVAHFAANKSIEADIYVVIDELCCSQKCKDKILPSSSRLKTDDIENIYAMATLTALLAAKHCVSAHALIVRLLEGVFRPFTGGKPIPGADKLEHMYRGLLLGTFIISMLICGTELPFCVDPVKQEKPGDRMPSDIRGIRTLFIRELNDTLMPILSILFLVAEPDKGDDDRATARTAWFKAPQYTASIQPVLKAAIRSICEQDWVNQRVFELCEKGRLEMFAKLRNNSQSQKIIRLALRRKCERNLKEELIANAENTVRLFLTRLFSSMNVWNMRAIIYDLRLMIKENEKIEKSTHTAFTQHQMLHLYDNLTQTIAGSCREYFMTMSPDKEGLQPIKVGKGFQLSQINPFWLMAPLIQSCPQPSQRLTSAIKNVNSVQQQFLKEAQGMLNYQDDQNRTWLLSQKPFLNLLYTSLMGESNLRDALVTSVHKQFSEIANRAKDSTGLPFQKQFKNERDGIIVRLSVCGGMFKSMLNAFDQWTVELFKLLFYEVITYDRDPLVYEMCYDMLSTLIIYSIIESHENQDGEERNGNKSSPQDEHSNHSHKESSVLPSKYKKIMKKLMVEIQDRTIPTELKDLLKLLYVAKPLIDVPVVEPFGSQSSQINSKSSKNSSSQFSASQGGPGTSNAVVPRGANAKYGAQFNGRKEQLSTFDFIQGYYYEGMPKNWKWSWFQANRLDKYPVPMQKQVLRMLYHTHYLEYTRPTLVGKERPPRTDIFLTPPVTEEMPPDPHNAPTPHALHGNLGMPPQPNPGMQMNPMVPQNPMGQLDPSQMAPQGPPGMVPSSVPNSMQQPPNSMHAGFPGGPPHPGMPHPGMGKPGGMPGPAGMPGPHPDYGGMRPQFPGKPMGMMGKPGGMHPGMQGGPMGGMRGPHQQPVRAAMGAAAGVTRKRAAGNTKANSKRRKDSKSQVQANVPELQMPQQFWPNANQASFAPGPQANFMGQGSGGGPAENSHQDSKQMLHEHLMAKQRQPGLAGNQPHPQNAFGPGGPGGAPAHYQMMQQPDHQGGFTQNSGQTGQRYL